jgi:hypothetical protein
MSDIYTIEEQPPQHIDREVDPHTNFPEGEYVDIAGYNGDLGVSQDCKRRILYHMLKSLARKPQDAQSSKNYNNRTEQQAVAEMQLLYQGYTQVQQTSPVPEESKERSLEIFNQEYRKVVTLFGERTERYYHSYGTMSAVIDMHASDENFISEAKAKAIQFPHRNPVTGPKSWLTEEDRLVRSPSLHTTTHVGQSHRGIEIFGRVALSWKDSRYYESYVEASFWVARHLPCDIVVGRANSQEVDLPRHTVLHPGGGKDLRPGR